MKKIYHALLVYLYILCKISITAFLIGSTISLVTFMTIILPLQWIVIGQALSLSGASLVLFSIFCTISSIFYLIFAWHLVFTHYLSLMKVKVPKKSSSIFIGVDFALGDSVNASVLYDKAEGHIL